MKRSRMVVSGVILAGLIMGTIFSFGIFMTTRAHADALATPTLTDFYTNGGWAPWGIAFDGSGRVWVAMPGCDPSPYCSSSTPPGKLDVYNPAAKSWNVSYQLPAGFGQPLFVEVDQQGMVWFTMPVTNTIGMLNPTTNTFSQWAVPTAGGGPWGLTIDHQGKLWFTEHYTNKIGSFDPTTHTFNEISTPATNSLPYGITVDSTGNIWFTENNSSVALIGEYTTGGTLNEYKIRNSSTSGLTPHMITVDQNGNVWWSEGWVSAVGELVVANAVPGTNNGVTEYTYQHVCSSCGTHTSGITTDSNGLVWFDDSLQSAYGYLSINGTSAASVYGIADTNAHPHDGLRTASNGVVWITEEFGNKLGYITGATTPPPATPTPTSTPTSTPTPTPTATSTPTPTPTPISTPTPTPTPTGSTLAQDSFQRINQTYWGTASDGHVWGGDASTSSVFSIANNAGLLTNGSMSYSAVLGPSTINAEVLFSGSISNFSNNNFGSVLRWTDGNNWYKAYINGSSLILQKKVNGSTTTLATVPFSATAGTAYSIRFRIVGTTLNAKAWATGSAEPSNWMTTATDSSLSSGQCGLRIQSFSATTTITSFLATAL